MITSKNDFYELLWKDFISLPEKDRHNSFLYRYFKQKKDIRAEAIGKNKEELLKLSARPKKDNYLLLKSAYFAFARYSVITEYEYLDILGQLSGRKKPISDSDIDEIQQRLERKFLMGCVGDYFVNLGYRVNKRNKHGMSVKQESKHRRESSYTDEFEMLYQYSRENERDYLSVEGTRDIRIDDEYIEKCSRLYESMLREKRTEAFVSLYVDSETGGGVYIIGQKHFCVCGEKPDEKEPCSIYIISFLSVDNSQNVGYNNCPELSISMSVVKKYKNVRDAFGDFIKMTENKVFFENYPDINISGMFERTPSDADARFEPFFLSRETRETLSLRKERIEKLRQKEIKAKSELRELYSKKRQKY